MNKEEKNILDLIIKIVLIIIIIILLIHNCTLMKKKEQQTRIPSGNIDIIEITCNNNECEPVNPPIEEINSISLSQNKISIKKGNTLKLLAIIKPSTLSSSKVTWKSSDSTIASVDENGNVKALKEGTVTITVTSLNGKVATCTVIVTNNNIEVEKVVVNPINASIKVGSTAKLNVSVLPENADDKKITWTSSNPNIATVDSNGKITGIKEGTVIITATSANGKKANVNVKVIVDYVPVEKIILDKTEVKVKINEFDTIKATVLPENATDKNIIWISSDPSIATVDSNGKITGIKEGMVTITAKTIDGSVAATCNVKVEMDYIEDALNVYDKDKNPVKWNGATDLKIFTKSYYTLPGVIAPESEDIYQFEVKNKTAFNLKYDISFIETNNYNINMQYKLKKNDKYLIDHYVNANELNISDMKLDVNEHDIYYLEWKWVSSNNDTAVGKDASANYKLKIEINAESIN